jgi:hypothetical protein
MNKESDLKRNLVKRGLMTLAGVAMMAGLAGTAAASASSLQSAPAKPAVSAPASTSAQATKAGAVQAATTAAVNTRLLAGSHCYSWWQYSGNIWVESCYNGPYWGSVSWHPYYVIYDNFFTCTNSGTNCIDAHSYTYQYELDWYGTGHWYFDGPSGYTTYHQHVGFGPYYHS